MGKIDYQGRQLALGFVARTLNDAPDLFAVMADPLKFAGGTMRVPSGPAIQFADVPELPECLTGEEMESERWDGLS